MFFYACKGRGRSEGIFSRLKIKQLGACVLVVPEESQKALEEFLKKWNCPYAKRGSLVDKL